MDPDPELDLDPAIFVNEVQDPNKKQVVKKSFMRITF
jgi:hypothetical protein